MNPTRNIGTVSGSPASIINNACSCSGGNYEDANINNSDSPLLSSNAKFHSISAIAVAQDGVINVADQGIFETI